MFDVFRTELPGRILPREPWLLIRHALRDLALCEADPRYVIDMRTWHEPRIEGLSASAWEIAEAGEAGVGFKCHVCLSGAVMAKTFGFRPHQSLAPIKLSVGQVHPDDQAGLRTINNFRSGLLCADVMEGAPWLDTDDLWDWLHGHMPEAIYYDALNPQAFHDELRRRADRLEAYVLGQAFDAAPSKPLAPPRTITELVFGDLA
ncbi:MAG: hypothetical protein ACE37J_11795 [Pikeienuella sp.]|uniref:hypothetical protein n=1 Tax=Pikeienuella sp. TaxID=2831957 RepID=UPI00391B775E